MECYSTRPDPDILNCEVKWALGYEQHYMSNTNGGDRIQDVLFKILKKKMMLLKGCKACVRHFGKLSSGQRTGKGQFPFQSLTRTLTENVQTTVLLCSFHMLAG